MLFGLCVPVKLGQVQWAQVYDSADAWMLEELSTLRKSGVAACVADHRLFQD